MSIAATLLGWGRDAVQWAWRRQDNTYVWREYPPESLLAAAELEGIATAKAKDGRAIEHLTKHTLVLRNPGRKEIMAPRGKDLVRIAPGPIRKATIVSSKPEAEKRADIRQYWRKAHY